MLAHRTADADAPTFSCRRDKTRVVGAAQALAQGVIGYDGPT
jgi:hypothetical protein